MKGRWEVMKVEMDHNDENAMEFFLNSYRSFSKCCQYIVDFKEDNICTGTFIKNDTLVYTVIGKWQLKEFNILYVNLDEYINADFDVDRHSSRFYTLVSPNNKVKIFNDAEVHVKAIIKKID